VPVRCPGVPEGILFPARSWRNRDAYRAKAEELAAAFRKHFSVTFAHAVPPEVAARCPGE